MSSGFSVVSGTISAVSRETSTVESVGINAEPLVYSVFKTVHDVKLKRGKGCVSVKRESRVQTSQSVSLEDVELLGAAVVVETDALFELIDSDC